MSVSFNWNNQTFDFRNPSMGNGQDLVFQRINAKTRGGDLIVARDANWPKTETLRLKFDFLNESDKTRFMLFLRNSSGDIVYYRDHENRVWRGIIQNPAAEAIQTGRSSFQIDVVFEGDLQ